MLAGCITLSTTPGRPFISSLCPDSVLLPCLALPSPLLLPLEVLSSRANAHSEITRSPCYLRSDWGIGLGCGLGFRIFKTLLGDSKGASGWFSWLNICLLILAQVLLSGSWD